MTRVQRMMHHFFLSWEWLNFIDRMLEAKWTNSNIQFKDYSDPSPIRASLSAVSIIHGFFRNIHQKIKIKKKSRKFSENPPDNRREASAASETSNYDSQLRVTTLTCRDADAPTTACPERSDWLTLPNLFVFTLDFRIFFNMYLIYFIILTFVVLIYYS